MSRWVLVGAFAVTCVFFARSAHAQDDGIFPTSAPTPATRPVDDVPYYLRPPPTDGSSRVDTPIAAPLAPVLEPPAARFGARGQIVMTGSTTVGLGYSLYDGSDARYFSATFAPALDYFVVRNLAIGAQIYVGYSDGRGYGADGSLVETKSTTVLIGPRVSYNIPLGRYVSFYPSVSFAAGAAHRDESLVSGSSLSISGSTVGGASTSEADAQVAVAASLYFHPRSHVIFGIGPSFSHDFARVQGGLDVGAQATSISGGVTVGGYWGGDRTSSRTEDSAPPRRTLRRFGDAHEVAFTNEILTQGAWTTHSGTESSSSYLEFLLAADYFVAPHVSIGGVISGGLQLTSGIDAKTKLAVNTHSDSLGLGFRLGYQIPILDSISFYPRATLGVGVDDYDETSGATENSYSTARIDVAIYAPLVVEVAPHFFLGLGPSVAHDLTNATPDGRQNRETTYGIGSELGVWL